MKKIIRMPHSQIYNVNFLFMKIATFKNETGVLYLNLQKNNFRLSGDFLEFDLTEYFEGVAEVYFFDDFEDVLQMFDENQINYEIVESI
jgi:hypothetical protein